MSEEKKYFDLIQAAAKKYKVDPETIYSMMMAESSGNPMAVSNAGAKGLMQLMPGTARDVLGKGDYNLFDPSTSIEAGTKYYSQMLEKFGGDKKLALAAYNAGPGAVMQHGGVPPYAETQKYVDKIYGSSPQPSSGGMSPANGLTLDKIRDLSVNGSSTQSVGSAGQIIGGAPGANAVAMGENGALYGTGGEYLGVAGDTAMQSGINGGTVLADGTVVPAEAGMFDMAGIGSAGNAILPIAGVVGGYDLFKNKRGGVRGPLQGAASGAAIGSYFGPTGALIGGGIGLTAGAIQSLTMGKKSGAQLDRDDTRATLKQLGVIDNNYGITLADGSTFDMGKDGHAQLKGADGAMRRYWETDAKSPLTHQSIGWANPLAHILGTAQGKDAVQTQQLASYLTNATMSNASDLEGVRANGLAIMKKLGLNNDGAVNILKKLKDSGKISQSDYDTSVYGLGTMFSGKYEGKGKTSAVPPATKGEAPVPQNGTPPVPSNLKPVPRPTTQGLLSPNSIKQQMGITDGMQRLDIMPQVGKPIIFKPPVSGPADAYFDPTKAVQSPIMRPATLRRQYGVQ